MSYCIELLSLLNLELGKKYSREFIFEKIRKKKISRGTGYKINLWKLDSNFLNIIMGYNLINTNTKFYDLFYLKDHKWRKHYKVGFTKLMIYKMIDSLYVNATEPQFIYANIGSHVHEIIL